MSALKKRKLQHERSSFTEESPAQSKPSKKTMDKIDDAPASEPLPSKLPAVATTAAAVAADQKSKAKKRKVKHADSPPPAAEAKEARAERASSSDDANADATKDAEQTPVTNDEAEKSFADLGIIKELADACTALGYKNPTPIQRESIPLALQGRDIIGLAETGSGKTAAFALPILQDLLAKNQRLFGLVLAPTRELAYQIKQAFEALGSLISVQCAVLVGGMDMMDQSVALAKKPHIIVATPGRLLDHLENTKGFSLRALKYLVMDEADRLLDLDFGPILDKILRVLPRERHTYLFSATMSSKVESLQRASLSNPVRVSISSSSYQTVSTLLQYFLLVPHKYKDVNLISLLTEHVGQSTILFARTVHEVQRVAYLLRALGMQAIPIHGQLSQSSRLGALAKFRGGTRNILVATDVAARGLDIPSVDLVVNFDLPPDSKTYVHRVGRTARAGKSGKAINIVTQYDVEIYQRIEKALGKKLDEYPTQKDEVMTFLDTVNSAQKQAIDMLKKDAEKARDRGSKFGAGGAGGGKGGKGGKRRRDGMDADEG